MAVVYIAGAAVIGYFVYEHFTQLPGSGGAISEPRGQDPRTDATQNVEVHQTAEDHQEKVRESYFYAAPIQQPSNSTRPGARVPHTGGRSSSSYVQVNTTPGQFYPSGSPGYHLSDYTNSHHASLAWLNENPRTLPIYANGTGKMAPKTAGSPHIMGGAIKGLADLPSATLIAVPLKTRGGKTEHEQHSLSTAMGIKHNSEANGTLKSYSMRSMGVDSESAHFSRSPFTQLKHGRISKVLN